MDSRPLHISLYKVGGCVRDELLGVKPKDIDYAAVIESCTSYAEGVEALEAYLTAHDYTIFLKNEDTLTFRAKNNKTKELADFVLARHELGYAATSRKPNVVLGTLEQDLRRRDFTVNALALDADGGLIDLFGGREDLARRVLRTPLDPVETLLDDPLRLFRALRFSVTKEMAFDPSLWVAFNDCRVYEKLWRVVSAERIREELFKMFSYDSAKTMRLLVEFSEKVHEAAPTFIEDLFGRTGLWLKPTREKVGK